VRASEETGREKPNTQPKQTTQHKTVLDWLSKNYFMLLLYPTRKNQQTTQF